jgi:hypothetical protein
MLLKFGLEVDRFSHLDRVIRWKHRGGLRFLEKS